MPSIVHAYEMPRVFGVIGGNGRRHCRGGRRRRRCGKWTKPVTAFGRTPAEKGDATGWTQPIHLTESVVFARCRAVRQIRPTGYRSVSPNRSVRQRAGTDGQCDSRTEARVDNFSDARRGRANRWAERALATRRQLRVPDERVRFRKCGDALFETP